MPRVANRALDVQIISLVVRGRKRGFAIQLICFSFEPTAAPLSVHGITRARISASLWCAFADPSPGAPPLLR